MLDIAAMMVKSGVTTEEIDHAVHLVKLHLHMLLFKYFMYLEVIQKVLMKFT